MDLVGSEREADRFFAMPVQDRGKLARAAEPLVVAFTKGLTFFDA